MNRQKKLPEKYLHQNDQRTQKQIFFTNQIVRNLTELNLSRIRNKQSQHMNYELKNEYFFLCLTGIPKFNKQFQNFQLPGRRIIYTLTGLQKKYTQEQYLKIYTENTIQKQAANLDKIISSKKQNQKLVVIFHSFGAVILNLYFKLYGTEKVFGFIDLGGFPISMHKLFKRLVINFNNVSLQQILQNADFIHQEYIKNSGGAIPFENKYQLIIFLKTFKSQSTPQIFSYARKYPKIIKIFAFGRKDDIFEQALLNQKAVHYCYFNKIEDNTQKILQQRYKKLYNTPVKNVQQRFIFNFQNAKHSLHMQAQFIPDLNAIIKQYLLLIEGTC